MNAHHSSEERRISEFFDRQQAGTQPREYPRGRLNGDDEGALAVKIAVDHGARRIIIAYPKPVAWVGMALNEAEHMRHLLSEKIKELKGIPPGPPDHPKPDRPREVA